MEKTSRFSSRLDFSAMKQSPNPPLKSPGDNDIVLSSGGSFLSRETHAGRHQFAHAKQDTHQDGEGGLAARELTAQLLELLGDGFAHRLS